MQVKKYSTPLGFLFLVAAGGALAHAHLKISTPAEGAVLMESPPTIMLTFSEATRMTALSIQKDREPKRLLQAPTSAAAEKISVAVPKLAAGSYTLSWRVVSNDNHIMSGKLHFKVAPMDMPMKH